MHDGPRTEGTSGRLVAVLLALAWWYFGSA